MAAEKNNYFKTNIAKFGDTFISLVTPDQIQGQAKRIVKELVRGEIEFEKYGQFFLDMKFLDNLIIGIRNELDDYNLYYTAVNVLRMYNPNIPNITVRENHLAALCYIYSVVLTRLEATKTYQDVGCLADISALLYNYRMHIK